VCMSRVSARVVPRRRRPLRSRVRDYHSHRLRWGAATSAVACPLVGKEALHQTQYFLNHSFSIRTKDPPECVQAIACCIEDRLPLSS